MIYRRTKLCVPIELSKLTLISKGIRTKQAANSAIC